MQCRRPGFSPWVGKIPWRREWPPIPVFWPGKFHGLYSILYIKLNRRVFHACTFWYKILVKWLSWLLIEGKKGVRVLFGQEKTHDTAQNNLMDLHGICWWRFWQFVDGVTWIDRNLRGRDENAGCITQIWLNSTICCSVAQSCQTLCDPMDCSPRGFPVLHYLSEFAQTHVHWVSHAIQPSHPSLLPSPPVLNPSQHQGLFQGNWTEVANSPQVSADHSHKGSFAPVLCLVWENMAYCPLKG